MDEKAAVTEMHIQGCAAAPFQLEAARQSVILRAQQSIHTGPTVLVAGILCGFVLAYTGAGIYGAAWAAMVVATALINRVACHRIVAIDADATASLVYRRQRELKWLTVMNTLVMGAGVWVVDLAQPPTSILYALTVLQTLYQLGALINASTHPPTFILGTWINLGSMVVFWALQGANGLLTAVPLFALVMLCMRFSSQIHKEFLESVRIRFENADLLEQVRQQMQQANQARESAERANSAKSRFLAGASHDLRQPLHSLLIFASLLEKAEAAQRGDYLRQLRTAAASLERLLNGLMDLSRLDANAFSVRVDAIDLAEVSAPVIDEARVEAAAKGLRLDVDLPHIFVVSDPLLFERILRNLVDNAIKYTSKGAVRVSAVREEDRVRLVVSDDGVGIAEADHNRIFHEFERLRHSGADTEDGFGLGLAIVARGCHLLGHEIALDSVIGVGSRFTITMRCARKAELPARKPPSGDDRKVYPAASHALAPGGANVLVVDDNTGVRAATAAIVATLGGECHPIGSLQELRQLLHRSDPPRMNAMIADWRLNGEAIGLELVQTIRARFPALPVALVTADRDQLPPEVAATGVRIFPKPVADDVLIDWIMSAVEAPPDGTSTGESRHAA